VFDALDEDVEHGPRLKARLLLFVKQHDEKLKGIYSRFATAEAAPALLFSPASLYIFERIENAPLELKTALATAAWLTQVEWLASTWHSPFYFI
jgi:hypothetical protein